MKSLRTLSRRMIWSTYEGDQITLAYSSKGPDVDFERLDKCCRISGEEAAKNQ